MTSGRQILIVDGDTTLVEMLSEQLQLREEFATATAALGAVALELSKNDFYDVIILDANLPDMDGWEVCRVMRQNGIRSPIIMLSGVESDIELGREAGANDYITKPFRVGVLLTRLRAQIRQHERCDDAVLTIGPFTFRPADKFLLNTANNKMVRLTDKETAIIKHLYRAGERMVGRDVLLDKIWGYGANVTTHTLETHVYRLRQKIEHDPSSAQILVTEPGGYRLIS
ncbi:MAG: DNA-binding response regulator [Magnetovibrio sp.]|nr:DNA-binding response regulator [Magnetovibrio sp.]